MCACRYGWHFPELGKLITDNIAFIKTVKLVGTRENMATSDLSDILPEDVEERVKEAAEISMGTEISEDDILNIQTLCDEILSINEYRTHLSDYLKARMLAMAPNLTVLVGETIGARLIAHAGSLVNLAKHPASTVQILGMFAVRFAFVSTLSSIAIRWWFTGLVSLKIIHLWNIIWCMPSLFVLIIWPWLSELVAFNRNIDFSVMYLPRWMRLQQHSFIATFHCSLGAEKALFRALKTKKDTPKYGLIYHAQLIGSASLKNKGKMARSLAAKASLATRVNWKSDESWRRNNLKKKQFKRIPLQLDAFGEDVQFELGVEHKAKLESRLRVLEEGNLRRLSGTGKAKAKLEKHHVKTEVLSYPQEADSTLPSTSGKKRKLIEDISETVKEEPADHEETADTTEKKKKKKKKNKNVEEAAEEAEVEAPPKKKSKAELAPAPVEEAETVEDAGTEKKKKKKKKKNKSEDE